MKRILLFIISVFFIYNIQAQAFSLDTSFNLSYNFYFTGSGATVYGLNYEPDGKMMIYGHFDDGYFNPADVLRIYEDGSLDNTWTYPIADGIAFAKRLNNNYIILSLSTLFKFNYWGQSTDSAWANNVWRGNICHQFYKPYFLSDGSMLVGGDSACNIVSDKKRCFMKFLPDGNIDTNFKHGTNRPVFGIVKYSSDQLLVYGGSVNGFTKYDTTTANRMCRIDTLGNLDTTFKSIFTGGSPLPFYIQNDGKIIVVGYFNIVNYPTALYLIRLNTDGSLDSTFNNTISTESSWASSVCPTTDGGYLIGGGFKQYQGYIRNDIVKTDINGFIDTAYFNGLGFDSVFNQVGGTPDVQNIVKGTNDTYYVMGDFTYYNGVHVNPIIRIHGLSVGINEVEKEKKELKVFPNPAKDYVTFIWELPLLKDNAELIITDISGKSITQKTIATKRGQWVWDTRTINKGIYLYEIKTNTERFGNGKVVINGM
ncbi:MAG: T9SS type A sorting domain-containing protein [Bacteroidetes bacterium]|nr:T9SS type A sorting domain-containing protein [Bacteroidota bacterium]